MAQAERKPHLQQHSTDVDFYHNVLLLSENTLKSMAPDQNTQFHMMDNFHQYYLKTLQNTKMLPNETSLQFRQRMGWAMQAAAIEIAGEYGLKRHPKRLEWKNDVTQQILKAQQENPQHSLPGINTYFREAFQGHLDQYSSNTILINFNTIPAASPAYTNHDLLHLGSVYNDQLEKFGQTTLYEQWKYLRPITRDPISSAYQIMGELIRLCNMRAEGVKEDLGLFINKRWRLLRDLFKSTPSVRDALDIKHFEEKGFHALKLELTNPVDEGYTVSFQMQPEEVTREVWEFFKSVCQERYPKEVIPSRELCMKITPPVETNSTENTTNKPEDEEWGDIIVPKILKQPLRREELIPLED